MELIRPHVLHPRGGHSSRGSSITTSNLSSAPAASPKTAPTCDNGGGGSKRQEVKILLRRLRRDNPNIERSIFNSIHAVNLDMMPGYKTGGVLHSFLDDYDERGKKSE